MTEPAQRALRILHLSDTHLFGDGTLHYGVVDTTAALQRALNRAAALRHVDVVVASGDLSDDGSEASYRTLRGMLEPWAAERGGLVLYAMGNHDDRAGFEAMLGERVGVSRVRGLRIVRLDSSVPGSGYGEVDAEQLRWLRAELRTPAEHGTVVVLHHPPTPARGPLLKALELQNPDGVLRACAEGDVRLVLSGHYHHSLVALECGIPVVVAPGIANTSQVIADDGHERATIGAGFALIDVPLDGVGADAVAAGAPSVAFVAAPSPDDGVELFDLDPGQIAAVAASSATRR